MNQIKCTPAQLHPASFRHLNDGHPWVIKDDYTERFGAKSRLLIAHDNKKKKTYTLIADTAHPKIKARLWADSDCSQSFFSDLTTRLETSFSKRNELFIKNDRTNIMMSFGENDYLPGLLVLFLDEGLIIQNYCGFWKKIQKELVNIIRETFTKLYPQIELKWLGWQERDHSQKADIKPLWGKLPDQIRIKEYDLNYIIKLKSGYDLGIYTDMAALRAQYRKFFTNKSVLNLYAYTGAWSAFSLENGASECTSIDLSPKYMKWLEDNLQLNTQIENHHSLIGDVNLELEKLIKDKKKFDFIICDPPSFSSDGKKTTSSLDNYPQLIGKLSCLLKPGARALIFLNTHKIIRKRFESHIMNSIKKNNLIIKERLFLSEDCKLIKGFSEGDYLKGLELIKKENV